MDRLKMHSVNKIDENIKKIAELFPNTVTEVIKGYRDDGSAIIEHTIDFDVLRQELSDFVVEGTEERYQFTWPDKKKSILLANAPIAKTLRPCRDESLHFDSTENLYIEGDNLEALKILQETYLNKIKMIYIDPPYNTGKDFLYEDDFVQNTEEYLANSGQFDSEGNRLVQNTESNGRIHTDWLNMMYPRLQLAKDLLSDDGVIFISIDDNEVDNLTKICNEVFGKRNCIAVLTREAIKGGSLSKFLRVVHDYILVYSKDISNVVFGGIEKEGIVLDQEDEKGKYAKGRELNKWGAGSRREDAPGMWFPIPGPNGEKVYPIRNDGSEGRWRLGKEKLLKLVNNGDVIFEKREDGTYIVYEKIRDNSPKIKQFTTLFKDEYINAKGTEELKKLFNMERAIFDYSKPVKLIYDLMLMSNVKDDEIVMDFFSGSSTTAQAVMQMNADKGGNRKFIMIQLPEETDQKSEAYKAGYKNICDIGKERIRRAGKKILDENPEAKDELDIGFRVLKVDTTNMQDVYYNPTEYKQDMLSELEDNIKPDRTPEDLLFQVMLDLGVLLSSKIEEINLQGKKVFNVADGYLIACFDNDVTSEVITEVAKQQPYYAVFRDSSLANDSVVTNFEQIFETYSPTTVRKVL